MPIYTFTQKASPLEPGQESNFGGLENDGNHNAMQFGAGPQTVDATGTPLVSPLTVSNVSVSTLNIPVNAVQLNIFTLTNTLNVSEADNTVATKFFTVPTGIMVTIDVARTAVLYLKANVGAATVSFWFNIV